MSDQVERTDGTVEADRPVKYCCHVGAKRRWALRCAQSDQDVELINQVYPPCEHGDG